MTKSGGAKVGRSRGGRTFKFDQALEELEALVASLESGDLGLEASLKLFEQGVKLTRNCQQALDSAQQKVETLIEESGIALSDDESEDESDDESRDEYESDEIDGAEMDDDYE